MHIEGEKLEYRDLKTDDYESVMALWNQSVGVGISPDDTRQYLDQYLRRNPGISFVAVDHGTIVGAIMAGHDGYRGYIHHTSVAENYRHCGIGTELVQLSLDALKKENIHKVALVAFSNNESGNAFWEAQHFTIRNDLCYRNVRILEE